MNGGHMKEAEAHLKVVLRHLPPVLSQSALKDQIDDRFDGRYSWFYFRPGRTSHRNQQYSRAYVDFRRLEDVIEFAQAFHGHVFVNEKGSHYKAIVEYAPSQRLPKTWSKKDGREGTIFKDIEYLEFLEMLAKPVENLPSAEVQLERREAERAGLGVKDIIITPLMEYVRQKRAAKSGSQLTEPLVRVLRLVDGEKNVMGYLFEAMDRAKEAIQHYYRGDANRFAPIWDIIDRRWNNQLHQPIHAVGYFLNPKFYFSESGSFTDDNGEVMEGLITCIERMTPISATRDLILLELQNYKAARGQLFSSRMCVRGRGIQTPSSWWEDFGGNTPNLQRLALQILSQPCSASSCERNWSLFDAIHTKKRNKLTEKCLNDLVFVQYNLRLHTKKVQDQPDELIDLDDIDPYNDWTMQDNDPSLFTEDEIADMERQAMEDLPAAEAGEIGLDEIDVVEEEPVPPTSMVEPQAQSTTPSREPVSSIRTPTVPSVPHYLSRAGKRKI